ncbi:uncharacterized protein DS421_3g66270 [Arachis hypogaea]|nr:uncharacterized protein DS421_3g66270 [Arachis hypogaea]
MVSSLKMIGCFPCGEITVVFPLFSMPFFLPFITPLMLFFTSPTSLFSLSCIFSNRMIKHHCHPLLTVLSFGSCICVLSWQFHLRYLVTIPFAFSHGSSICVLSWQSHLHFLVTV